MDEVYRGVGRTKDPIRWLSFQSRKAAFGLMEEWWRLRSERIAHQAARGHDATIRPGEGAGSKQQEHRQRGDGDRKEGPEAVGLSAMATLCCGPISMTPDSKSQTHLSFDVRRMLEWIDGIFSTVSDKTQAIGRRALKNLISTTRSSRTFSKIARDVLPGQDD